MLGVKSAERNTWGVPRLSPQPQPLAETNHFHLLNLRLDLREWSCSLEQMDKCDGCHRALEMLTQSFLNVNVPLTAHLGICEYAGSDSVSVSVSQGCSNKSPHPGWLQAMCSYKFWRPEVWNQDVSVLVPSRGSEGESGLRLLAAAGSPGHFLGCSCIALISVPSATWPPNVCLCASSLLRTPGCIISPRGPSVSTICKDTSSKQQTRKWLFVKK